MLEPEVLRVIAAALRVGFHQPYSDHLAAELGLTWDRWFVSRYAGNPGVAAQAMGMWLDTLADRLADERVQILLAELAGVDKSLAEKRNQLGASVSGEFFRVGEGVKNFPGGVDVV